MKKPSYLIGKKIISCLLAVLMLCGCICTSAVPAAAEQNPYASWPMDGHVWNPVTPAATIYASTDMMLIYEASNGKTYALANNAGSLTSYEVHLEANGLIRVSQFGSGNSANFSNTYYFSSITESYNNQDRPFKLASNGVTYYSLTTGFELNSSGGNFYLDENSYLTTSKTYYTSNYSFATYNGYKVRLYWRGGDIPVHTVQYQISSASSGMGTLSGTTVESVYNLGNPTGVPTPVPTPGYKFDGWSTVNNGTSYVTPSAQTTTANTTFYANFSYDPNAWVTVTYVIGDKGTASGELTKTVVKGSAYSDSWAPTVNGITGYTFTGWENKPAAGAPVNENITITAQYGINAADWATVTYSEGAHGSFNEGAQTTQTVLKGTAYSTSWRPGVTADRGYTFSGWGNEPAAGAAINNDVTITAQYGIKADDWATVEYVTEGHGSFNAGAVTTQTVLKGSSYNEAWRPAYTAESGYTFSGWDNEPVTVTDNVTVKAVFVKDPAQWATVTYVIAAPGSYVSGALTKEVVKGTPYSHDWEPQLTAETGWEFTGWSPAVTTVDDNITLYAQFSKITSMWATLTYAAGEHGSIDAGETTEREVLIGTAYDEAWRPAYTADPGYTFSAWNNEPVRVDGNVTVTVNFVKDSSQWATVTYTAGEHGSFNEGAETTQTVLKGTAYSTSWRPDITADYGYTFSGWGNEPAAGAAINNDVTITAQYGIKADDWATVEYVTEGHGSFNAGAVTTQTVLKGSSYNEAWRPAYTAESGYTFSGWDNEPVTVTDNVTVKAVFVKDPAQWATVTYVIAAPGSYVSGALTKEVVKGTPYSHDWEPQLTAETGWEFTGWSPAVTTVDDNITLYAQFSKITSMWATLTYAAGEHGSIDAGETTEREVLIGTAYDEAWRPAYTADPGYTFSAWNNEPVRVDGNVTVTVNFVKDSSQWATVTYTAGEHGAFNAGETTEREVLIGTAYDENWRPEYTAQEGYRFHEWTGEPDTVTGNVEITAVFEQITYSVSFINDGSEIHRETVGQGIRPAGPDADPDKENTAQYSYTFTGWTDQNGVFVPKGEAFPAALYDTVYTAAYETAVNTYEIIWKNWNGDVLETDPAVAYGETPEFNGSTPVKTPDGDPHQYIFAGWTPEVSPVTGDVTYVAVFETATATVTYVIENAHGDISGDLTRTCAVGDDYQTTWRPAVIPDAGWTYSFVGEPDVVTGNTEIKIRFEKIPEMWATITYASGGNGSVSGTLTREVLIGTAYSAEWRPSVSPDEGYELSGWQNEPVTVSGDTTITALFTEIFGYGENPTREIQFVISHPMHFKVYKGSNEEYFAYSQTTPVIYWYPSKPFSFSLLTYGTWSQDGYMVSANGKEIYPDENGVYTIPAGEERVQINCYPIPTVTSADQDICAYCGKVHPSTVWGFLSAMLHNLFMLIKNIGR